MILNINIDFFMGHCVISRIKYICMISLICKAITCRLVYVLSFFCFSHAVTRRRSALISIALLCIPLTRFSRKLWTIKARLVTLQIR